MTGAELYTYILREFLRTNKETEAYDAITDTVFDIWRTVNTSVYDGKRAYNTVAISDGDYIVNLPDDFGYFVSGVLVEDTASTDDVYTLTKLSFDIFQEKFQDLTTTLDTDVPEYYAILGDTVYFAPAFDDSTYRVLFTYAQFPTTSFTSATANVPFSDRHREIIKNGVIARLYKGLQNYPDAAEYFSLYQAGKRDLEMFLNKQDSTEESIFYSGF